LLGSGAKLAGMKTNPGMVVGAAVLIVATALVTWLIARTRASCGDFLVYDNLDKGFYSLVIKEQTVGQSQSDELKKYLGTLKKPENKGKVAFCFTYVPKSGNNDQSWQDGFPNQTDCPKEDDPTNGTQPIDTNMSVLSHKIYSIRACDIEKVIEKIK